MRSHLEEINLYSIDKYTLLDIKEEVRKLVPICLYTLAVSLANNTTILLRQSSMPIIGHISCNDSRENSKFQFSDSIQRLCLEEKNRTKNWKLSMNSLASTINSQRILIDGWETAIKYLHTVIIFPCFNKQNLHFKEKNNTEESTQETTYNGSKLPLEYLHKDGLTVKKFYTNQQILNRIEKMNVLSDNNYRLSAKRPYKSNSFQFYLEKNIDTAKRKGIEWKSRYWIQSKLIKVSKISFYGKSTDTKNNFDTRSRDTNNNLNDASEIERLDVALIKQLREREQNSDSMKSWLKTCKYIKIRNMNGSSNLINKIFFRPLTHNDRKMVENAIYGHGSLCEIIASSSTDSVQRYSMHQLQPKKWLNDEIIHYFYLMLSKRDEYMCMKNPKRKLSHFFKSFFFTKLFDEGATNRYVYRNVKRWSKNVHGKDIFMLDKIFFPCNISNVHWACVVIYIQDKRIQFYDSMGGDGMHYINGLMSYIKDEWNTQKGGKLPNIDDWELISCTKNIPRQENGFDCGVFACMFADFLSQNIPLTFSQEDIDEYRKRIAFSILKGVAIV